MAEKIIKQIYGQKASVFSKYREMCVGNESFLFFLYFEFVTGLLRNMGGAAGLFLRSRMYRPLFGKIGKGVVFGCNVTIRNPRGIRMGDHVVIDDNCVLDAKGNDCRGIVIGDEVFISRNVIIGCKDGGIQIGSNSSIGPNTTVHSVAESTVSIGDHAVIAAYCYIIGGADYESDRIDVPMAEQGLKVGQGISVGEDVWLGAAVLVLDGSRIEKGVIVGANSLVRGLLPEYSVCVGTPAVVKGQRKGKKVDD